MYRRKSSLCPCLWLPLVCINLTLRGGGSVSIRRLLVFAWLKLTPAFCHRSQELWNFPSDYQMWALAVVGMVLRYYYIQILFTSIQNTAVLTILPQYCIKQVWALAFLRYFFRPLGLKKFWRPFKAFFESPPQHFLTELGICGFYKISSFLSVQFQSWKERIADTLKDSIHSE